MCISIYIHFFVVFLFMLTFIVLVLRAFGGAAHGLLGRRLPRRAASGQGHGGALRSKAREAARDGRGPNLAPEEGAAGGEDLNLKSYK